MSLYAYIYVDIYTSLYVHTLYIRALQGTYLRIWCIRWWFKWLFCHNFLHDSFSSVYNCFRLNGLQYTYTCLPFAISYLWSLFTYIDTYIDQISTISEGVYMNLSTLILIHGPFCLYVVSFLHATPHLHVRM